MRTKSTIFQIHTTSSGPILHIPLRNGLDAIYLTISRNDDVTHVYDARMMGRGILHAFEHTSTTHKTPGVDSYGVMEAYWVENSTRRLGLMTGGNDGDHYLIAFF